MSVKERLIQFLNYKGISKSEFGRVIGVSNSFVSSMAKSIQPDKLKRITLNYPELNPEWLLTGEGEMIRNEPVKNNSDVVIPRDVLDIMKKQADSLEKRDSQIDELIGMLKDQLNSKKVGVLQEDGATCAGARESRLAK